MVRSVVRTSFANVRLRSHRSLGLRGYVVELDLTSDQELFVDTTRRFLEAESPLTAVRELDGDPVGFTRDFWRRGAELGWVSLLVGEDHGGGSVSGRGLLDLVLVAEEM